MSLNCDYCDKKITSITVWSKHVSEEMDRIQMLFPQAIPTCRNCHIVYDNFKQLQVHLKSRACRRSNLPRFQCDYCQKHFTTRVSMTKHMNKYLYTCITIIRENNKFAPRIGNRTFNYEQTQLFPDLKIDQVDAEFGFDIKSIPVDDSSSLNAIDLCDLDLSPYEFDDNLLCFEEYIM